MTADWFPANPSTWPDLRTFARQAVLRLYPPGLLFDVESDEYKDVQAKGDSYTWIQEALWWIRTAFWPQFDDEALFLDDHEESLSIATAATTTLRQSSIIAHYRTLRRALTDALTKAIFCRVFGSDDPADVDIVTPATVDIWRSFGWLYADQATGSQPSARSACRMVYDSTNDSIILFGGYDGARDNETWTYNPGTATWTNKAPAGPPGARHAHAMCFNPDTGLVYLFGGNDAGGADAETWTYDLATNTWTNKAPGASPGARQYHDMVYDSAREVIVMFGGTDAGGLDAETWEYSISGNTWTNAAPAASPGAREKHSMCYNVDDGLVYMFGGDDAVGADAETWAYNGTTWTQLTPTDSPDARSLCTGFYHLHRQSFIIVGGYDGVDSYEDAWEYYDGNWHQHHDIPVPLEAISERYGHGIAYDWLQRIVVIFGGTDGTRKDDTWHCSMIEADNTWARYQTFSHVFSAAQDTDEDYPLGQTMLIRCTPSGYTYTVGRYAEGEYGSTADSTEFGTYDTCLYGTRD